MLASGLSVPIESAEVSNYIYAHLDQDQASDFISFSLRLTNKSSPLMDVISTDGLRRILEAITRETIEYVNQKQPLFDELQPRDMSREEFLIGFLEILHSLTRDVSSTNQDWLDEKHQQLLLIATEDKELFESWLADNISLTTPSQASARLSQIERNWIHAQLTFAGIARILLGDEYKPALPLLIEVFYENVAYINYVFDTQGLMDFWGQPRTQAIRLPRHPQSFSGYERDMSIINDEDMDRFLEELRKLRDTD